MKDISREHLAPSSRYVGRNARLRNEIVFGGIIGRLLDGAAILPRL